MAIGPIPDLRPLAVMESASDPELRAVSRIESAAAAGRNSSQRKQPPPRQDDNLEDLAQEEPVEAAAPEVENPTGGKISFFA
jgi:hypothetical protein